MQHVRQYMQESSWSNSKYSLPENYVEKMEKLREIYGKIALKID